MMAALEAKIIVELACLFALAPILWNSSLKTRVVLGFVELHVHVLDCSINSHFASRP
jgi:uncharacterized protein YqfA (UPF0365 family)